MDRALKRRADLVRELGGETDAWRLVHGSGDDLEGLTVDRLGQAILVERHLRGAPAERAVAELEKRFRATPIFLKERWSRDPVDLAGRQIAGPPGAPDEITVQEHGLGFHVRLAAGEHVGLFLDARPIRALLGRIAEGRRVLNLFSYSAGFGVAAASGGARSTTNVDNKRSALSIAQRNYELNALPVDTRTFLRDDAIRFLVRAAKGAGRYDLAVIDPPPRFERAGGKVYDALEGYGRLVTRCLNVIEPGGMMLAGSNAFGHDFAELERIAIEASASVGAHLEIVERLGPGPDFPTAPERPVGLFVLVRVARPGTGR
jgi:23S rRNA (cytosine1962-C5)-methyltransferase